MKNIVSIVLEKKGEIQTIVAFLLTLLLSQVRPFEERAYQLGVYKFNTFEGVGFACGMVLLAMGGWMLNRVLQTQRPDGTRNSLYFLSYILLTLSITNKHDFFPATVIGFCFALTVTCLHQATFQKRPETLVALSGFFMALLTIMYPAAYPWLFILLLLIILAEEFSFRMLLVFMVGLLMVPYLWMSCSFLFHKPILFVGWVGFQPWAQPEFPLLLDRLPWVIGVGALPVVAGIITTLMNRPSRTRISRSTQRQMGVMLISGICLLILAITRSIPMNPLPQIVFLLPAMTYLSARGLERMSSRFYGELFLWIWVALVCGGAEGLNRWVFSSFLPL